MVRTHKKGFDWLELGHTASTFVLLNLLWLFCSLLIITIPAATAALFASLAPWGRGQSPSEPLANFFAAMRQYAVKATAVTLLNLLIITVVTLNFLILRQIGTGQLITIMSLTVTIIVAIFLILTNVYMWPLLVTLEQSLPSLLKNALKLAVVHPFWGALVALTAVLPTLISLILPQAFFVTVTFATTVLIIYAGAWRIMRRYLSEQELKEISRGEIGD